MKYSSLRCLIVCCVVTSSCSRPHTDHEGIRLQHTTHDEEAIIFEGAVPFDSGKYVHMEVQLLPENDANGSFFVSETVIESEVAIDHETYQGMYNIYPLDSSRNVLILQNTKRPIPLRRTFINAAGNIHEENFRNQDLSFHLSQDHLVLLDNDNIVSSDARDLLYRRTSPVFTVEGYFMYKGDTSFFYETNTDIRWPLMKLGSYFQAAREHNTLAEKKNDTTYLKATGYCVRSTIPNGSRTQQGLVLKKILQSSTK